MKYAVFQGLQLASFLPDDAAVPEFDVEEALNADDVCRNYFKYLTESEQTSNHILEQTSKLVEELDKFFRTMVES